MPKVSSTNDGLWSECFPVASQPSSSLGAQIKHRVVIPAYTSTSVCSSIAYTASGSFQGEVIAQGPKSFLTVGAVKHRLGTAGYVEAVNRSGIAGSDLPKGQTAG